MTFSAYNLQSHQPLEIFRSDSAPIDFSDTIYDYVKVTLSHGLLSDRFLRLIATSSPSEVLRCVEAWFARRTRQLRLCQCAICSCESIEGLYRNPQAARTYTVRCLVLRKQNLSEELCSVPDTYLVFKDEVYIATILMNGLTRRSCTVTHDPFSLFWEFDDEFLQQSQDVYVRLSMISILFLLAHIFPFDQAPFKGEDR